MDDTVLGPVAEEERNLWGAVFPVCFLIFSAQNPDPCEQFCPRIAYIVRSCWSLTISRWVTVVLM